MLELTALGLALLVLNDEQETGTLRAQRQQDTLNHSRDECEAQEERPVGVIAHDHLQTKHLKSIRTHITYVTSVQTTTDLEFGGYLQSNCLTVT